MSARDFKGGGGFDSFDTYDKEELRGLSYVACFFLALRRARQTIGHMGEILGNLKPDIPFFQNAVREVMEVDTEAVVGMSHCTSLLMNGFCFFFLVQIVSILLNGVISISQYFMSGSIIGSVVFSVGSVISMAISIAIWGAVVAAGLYLCSTYFNQWRKILLYAYCVVNAFLLIVNVFSTCSCFAQLMGALTLSRGLLFLFRAIVNMAVALAGVIFLVHQLAVVSKYAET